MPCCTIYPESSQVEKTRLSAAAALIQKDKMCKSLFLMKTPLSEHAWSSELWQLCNKPTSDQTPRTHWGKSQQWKLLHHIKSRYTLSHCPCPPLASPVCHCVSKQTRVCRNMDRCDFVYVHCTPTLTYVTPNAYLCVELTIFSPSEKGELEAHSVSSKSKRKMFPCCQ